mgnify:CR=1 FL=1
MAKRNSKADTPVRKGKKSSAFDKSTKKTKASKVNKANKLSKHHRKKIQRLAKDCHALIHNAIEQQCKSNKHITHAEPNHSTGLLLSTDFEIIDANRHNAFIGDSMLDTLKNVIQGLAMLCDLIRMTNGALVLPETTGDALLLLIENLRRALTLERESQLGSV